MRAKFLLLLCLLLYFDVSAKSRKFIKLQQLETLSNSTVFSLYQDGLGAIWLSGNYGLYRYNGSSLEYRRGPLPLKPLSGDGQYLVYALGHKAIHQFDIRDYSEKKIQHEGIDYPNSAMHAEVNSLWIASRNNIYLYNNDSISLFLSLPDKTINITSILKNRRGELLLGTKEHGLLSINREKSIKQIVPCLGEMSVVFIDSNDDIWIGTVDKGAYNINSKTNELAHYHTKASEAKRLTNNFVRAFNEDKEKNIWIGTLGGLNIFENHLLRIAIPDGKLSEASVWSITLDNKGGMWLGTFYDGAYYYNSESYPFTSVPLPKERDVRLINAMVEDVRGDIWVFTDKFGMYRMEKNDHSKMHYILGSDKYKFKSAYYDARQDIIWIGTYIEGLMQYDIRLNRWTEYPFVNDDGTKYNEAINDIEPWGDKLYLATSHGVVQFNPEEKEVKRKPIPGYEGAVFSLVSDKKERLWFGGIGVFIYDFVKEKTDIYIRKEGDTEHNSQLNFIKLFNDSKDRIWGASLGQGFIMLNEKDKKQELIYNSENIGLLNNFTSFVDEIAEDILLIGTNSGLSIFDIANNRCYNYSRETGLGMTSARSGTTLRKSNGDILIGGMDGIESLSPSKLKFSNDSIDIQFDKLTINNRLIIPHGEDNILSQALPFVNEIVLDHDQTNIEIEMASFNFSKTYPIFYEYKLDGSDIDWTSFDVGQSISFMNLEPNEYCLKVRGRLDKSKDEYKEIEMRIVVKAAWYATPLAKILYFLVIFALILWLLYFAYSKMLFKQMLNQKEKENLDRMRFFINISHEIRTPLTLIIGQLELFFKRNKEQAENENIVSTYNNARRMQQIVTNLLDFEKQDQGYSRISISEVNLNEFIDEIKDSFVQYASFRNIDFEVVVPSRPLPIMIDKVAIQRVFSNLLINAFKYTSDSGVIKMEVEELTLKSEDFIQVKLSDNGKGISEDALPRIFDPFYQDASGLSCIRHNQGTGIGLALSKGIVELHHGTITASSQQGHGATFVFRLPLGDEWYVGDPNIELMNNEIEELSYDLELPIEALPETEDVLPVGKNKAKMLIAEDDNDLRLMLKSIFSQSYIIFEAVDGEEGLLIARQKQPDIIISDIVMPTMNGLSLCKNLKESFETSHIPIILLTAQSGIQHSIEGINVGADDYITKPFNVDLLVAKCANMMNNRRLVFERYSKSESIDEVLTTNDKDSEFINSVISVIEKNLHTADLNVSMLCRELGLGKTLLTAKLKGIAGNSPGEFIEIIRLKKAAAMLRNGDKNVSEIAYSMGFSSPKYFTIRFKRLFGKTPTEFIKD